MNKDQYKPLIDSFGRRHTYLRISVTDRCNLRCSYCMPPEGIETQPRDEVLTYEELLRVIELLSKLGISKVRFTGGEPLIRRGLPEFLGKVIDIPEIQDVGITTNGVLLDRHLSELKQTGLKRLNISLDTLKPERFQKITLRPYFHQVKNGIENAIQNDFKVKLNMVVMGGINDDELFDFVEYIKNKPISLRFIEYMPFSSNSWQKASFISWKAIKENLKEKFTLIPFNQNGETAITKEFMIPGYEGTVGFISSISDHFCEGCNRLRLLADGSLKSCIFYAPENNIREALRSNASDVELESIIRNVLLGKRESHESVETLSTNTNQEMVKIGG